MSEKASDFLKKLQEVVNSGDPSKGLDEIKRINKIHELASSMSEEDANEKLKQRFENAGYKDGFSKEEIEKIDIEKDEHLNKLKKEEDKLLLISSIENLKHDTEKAREELKEYIEKENKRIKELNDDLIRLKEEFYEKYGKG